MLNAITEKKPFVLGTRYGAGVEMDKDVYPVSEVIEFSGLCIVVLFLRGLGCLRVR